MYSGSDSRILWHTQEIMFNSIILKCPGSKTSSNHHPFFFSYWTVVNFDSLLRTLGSQM